MILASLGGLGMLVCGLMVIIKMFKNEKPLIGVLGLLCWLWAYIWGWMKSKVLGLKGVMMLWTLALVIFMIGYGIIVATAIKTGIDSGTLHPVEAIPAGQ